MGFISSSPCDGRFDACAQAHSRVMLGLTSLARSASRCRRLEEAVTEEEADSTSVAAESTLAVRDNAGYGRPAVLCRFLTRLEDRVATDAVWRGGESGGEDGMWDNRCCCSVCDVFLCVIGRTGEGYSDREATLSREGRARARVAGRSSSLGAGDSVSRGLEADVGVDEPDPDDDGSCPPALAFFLMS